MPAALELVAPSARLRESYRSLVAEFVARGERLVPFTLAFENADFGVFLAKLSDCAVGVGLPDGFVAHSTYWLVRDDAQVVGVSNIRHALTPALRQIGGHIGYGIRPSVRAQGYGVAILQHSLRRARALGLSGVLVTCDKQNAPSARIIVRNGGVLESEECMANLNEVVQRYWIDNA